MLGNSFLFLKLFLATTIPKKQLTSYLLGRIIPKKRLIVILSRVPGSVEDGERGERRCSRPARL